MPEMTELEKALQWCQNDLSYKAPELLADKEFCGELIDRYIAQLESARGK